MTSQRIQASSAILVSAKPLLAAAVLDRLRRLSDGGRGAVLPPVAQMIAPPNSHRSGTFRRVRCPGRLGTPGSDPKVKSSMQPFACWGQPGRYVRAVSGPHGAALGAYPASSKRTSGFAFVMYPIPRRTRTG